MVIIMVMRRVMTYRERGQKCESIEKKNSIQFQTCDLIENGLIMDASAAYSLEVSVWWKPSKILTPQWTLPLN